MTDRAVSGDVERSLRVHGFSIGKWRVEPRRNVLVSGNRSEAIDPRQTDVLIALAMQPGHVQTRDELLKKVWGGAFVTENSLTQAVSRLRRALGDDRREPTYIETVARSGYRLIAPVVPDEEFAPPRVIETGESTGRRMPTPRWLVAAVAILLVAASGLLWRALNAGDTPVRLPTLRPLSTLPGNQFGARLSPDGKYVSFAWQAPERPGWDIWIRNTGEDSPVRFTEHAHDERLATWAPDGGSLAFVRFGDDACGIFRKPMPDGPVDRMADCQPGMRAMDWSPLGTHLVLNGGEADRPTRSLFVHDLAGGERVRLTDPEPGIPGDGEPRFSPDGASIAFRRRHTDSQHDVMLVRTDGTASARALTHDRWGRIRGVEWSSDGRSVVFSSDRDGQFRLWKVGLDGGDPELLPVHDAWVTQPSIAREAGNMIYRTFRDSVDLWELPLDERGQARREPVRRMPSSRSERHPAWSPKADVIAFVSDRSGTLELWSGRTDGTALRRHTDLGGPQPSAPAWSPDGQYIAFDAAIDGHADIWIVGAAGRNARRLTVSTSEDRDAAFSPDGRWIYFTSDRSGDQEIWRIPARGGDAERVTTDGGLRAQPSPDGQALFFARLDESGIWRMPIDGGEVERVIDAIDPSDRGSWAVSERGIHVVSRAPTSIVFVPFDGGPAFTMHTPNKQIPLLGHALSVSRDGGRLLFSLIDHSDDEIMAVEQARF